MVDINGIGAAGPGHVVTGPGGAHLIIASD